MAYDEDLANQIRELLAERGDVTEKKMFGGLAFLIGGHMAVSASGQGGLLVRVDPDDDSEALSEPAASRMVMRGREMPGWIRVAPEGITSRRRLDTWVRRSVAFTSSLPPKG